MLQIDLPLLCPTLTSVSYLLSALCSCEQSASLTTNQSLGNRSSDFLSSLVIASACRTIFWEFNLTFALNYINYESYISAALSAKEIISLDTLSPTKVLSAIFTHDDTNWDPGTWKLIDWHFSLWFAYFPVNPCRSLTRKEIIRLLEDCKTK